MLDFKKELKNYPPIDIGIVTKKDPSIPDSIKNSMILYNKALESIEIESEDIAVIKLKKAISMNPGFYEAMNLMGIIYIHLGQKEKAEEVFKKIIEAEDNSIRAQRYIESISGGVQEKKAGKARRYFNVKSPDKKDLHLTFGQMLGYSFKKDIIKYIAGILIGIGIGSYLFGNVEIPDFTEERKSYENKIQKKTDEYDNLNEEHAMLKNEKTRIEEASAQKDVESNELGLKLQELNKIIMIENDAARGNILDAAKDLKEMEAADLEGEALVRYISLYKSILKEAAGILYEEAKNILTNGNNYTLAKEKLLLVKEYYPGFNNPSGLLYYTGKVYMLTGDDSTAKGYFNELISKYPNYQITQYAHIRLKEIIAREKD